MQPTNAPTVSILMPLYNAERFIYAALESLLRESTVPLEVIVVNDGSTDGSLRRVHKVRDRRLRIVDSQGKGIAAALNTGLAIAQGQITMRCDADDLYPAKRIAQQVNWLQQHAEFGAVCGCYSAIDSRSLPILKLDCGGCAEEITQELCGGLPRTHFCTFAVRTELLRSIGGFRGYFFTSEDIDLQLRLAEQTRIWYLPQIHYHYRLHNHSITHVTSSTEREFFDRLARDFQKQRLVTGQDDLQRGCPPPLPQVHEKPPLTAAQQIQGFLLGQAWQEYRDGRRLQAMIAGARSIGALPINLSVWRSVLSLSAKLIGGANGIFSKP